VVKHQKAGKTYLSPKNQQTIERRHILDGSRNKLNWQAGVLLWLLIF